MVEGLKGKILPWPDPKIVVFMNKAGYKSNTGLFRETKTFMRFVESAASKLGEEGSNIVFLKDAWVPLRSEIRKSIQLRWISRNIQPIYNEALE